MEIELLDTPVVMQRTREGAFEAALGFAEHSLSGQRTHFDPDGVSRRIDPRIAELLDQIANTGDPQEVDRLYRELHTIFREQQPLTYLFPWVRPWVVQRRLQGLSTPWVADPIAYLDRLWLKE